MKTLLLSPCCIVAVSVLLLVGNAEAAKLNWNTAAEELEFRAALNETNLDKKIKNEIFVAYVDYNAASTKLKELMKLNGLIGQPTPVPSETIRFDTGLYNQGSVATNDHPVIAWSFDLWSWSNTIHIEVRPKGSTNELDWLERWMSPPIILEPSIIKFLNQSPQQNQEDDE